MDTRQVEIVSVGQEALDAETSAEFRAEVAGRLGEGGRFLLDLSDVTFIDSTGIGAILACHRDAQAAGGALKLCGLGSAVRSAFEIVRMHRLLEIHPTREAALAAFTSEVG